MRREEGGNGWLDGAEWTRGLEERRDATGLARASWSLLAALLHHRRPRLPLVLVVPGTRLMERVRQDLATWKRWLGESGGPGPLLFPAGEDEKLVAGHAETTGERLEVLTALGEGPVAVVAEAAGLLQATFTPGGLERNVLRLENGTGIEPAVLVDWLEHRGYVPEAKVTRKGEVSSRGGIVDVFPLAAAWPVRIEFFGDEIDSIREFDPHTQLSRGRREHVRIAPGSEQALLEGTRGCLVDHLPPQAVLVVCHPADEETGVRGVGECAPAFSLEDVARRARHAGVDLRHWYEEVLEEVRDGTVLPAFENIELDSVLPDTPASGSERLQQPFFGRMRSWLEREWRVDVFCNNQGERDRFRELWEESGAPRAPRAGLGVLGSGFVCGELGWAVITDAEIFNRYKVALPRRLGEDRAAAVRSSMEIDFSDLEEGDYVVHLQHGIGRFVGLQRSDAGIDEGKGPEYLVIEYAARGAEESLPRLHVPVSEAHLVSKYIGAGKAQPRLHVLGGRQWSRAQARVREAVVDLAGEMLAVQATREEKKGHAFPGDTGWQVEFEGAFVYEETPDQLQAIEICKRDMESEKPMDRLICGDVGFGKTEVAIRAAFKAVMGGKQVALLVPTSVLAQQHYKTFGERMADYPVRVELLSRYRSPGRIRKILASLAEGGIDIVVGTHRLIQDDVTFKNLGLVIIDEEQRFGVRHKERFKRMRQLVDVLTLSATPIPRTLHMALIGARDMSTIETPPHDRLPVRTIVAPYDERVIRDAIQRELARQGQVFFLHNRVKTIDRVADRLRELVPEARVVVGHGQMDAGALEETMIAFVDGRADILVATTIIESGLDIPNANTIVIDRADRFGLSDLYQLRGRVGRYNRQAYAYLMIPRHAGVLSDAHKRINAMQQYARLGSGFKIAMRDLEIRGAGNLLGSQQSGHIAAIGFELYCELLKQSVSSLKGERVHPRSYVDVRIDFLTMGPEDKSAGRAARHPALLPREYIADVRQRIEIYRRLALVAREDGIEALGGEMRDRFGPLPPEVERLLMVARIKWIASGLGIRSLEVRREKVLLLRGRNYLMSDQGRLPRLDPGEPDAMLEQLRDLLLEQARVLEERR